jgi:hypothetical protein
MPISGKYLCASPQVSPASFTFGVSASVDSQGCGRIHRRIEPEELIACMPYRACVRDGCNQKLAKAIGGGLRESDSRRLFPPQPGPLPQGGEGGALEMDIRITTSASRRRSGSCSTRNVAACEAVAPRLSRAADCFFFGCILNPATAGPRTVPVRSTIAGGKAQECSRPARPSDVLRAGTARAPVGVSRFALFRLDPGMDLGKSW